METATMGQTRVRTRIENVNDYLNVKAGTLPPEKVRSIEVDDALVDTDARFLGLPGKHISSLGLKHIQTRQGLTSSGLDPWEMYSAVWLTIDGRQCTVDVVQVADECPVLIGYIPLESLDYVVDPINRRLIGNPQHGGQNIVDLM